jgi:Glyoxalase-like domain
VGPNRQWFELVADDADAEVVRLVSLGATRLRDGVLADPDGNEFTVSSS